MYGWIVILGLILLTSVILALLLRFTGMDGAALSWSTLIAGLISLFIGGIVSGIKSKQRGWVIGGITGLGFTVFTFLIQYLGYEQAFSLEQTLHHLGYILAALVGGVIGVNVTSREEE
ncbi:TIGR04086 family membrane protein [Virgibacillus siamensis]|uniref:TIGR04086 family membrane protein n=1 Tax=Virgibacillus siamensis TaxID=480071 RepID=UPI001FEC5DAA|nr:TIGR04086 family membrane protein [Virgibacillus siamensis]